MSGRELRMHSWNILLNLASEPRRNRRLYFCLLYFLLVLMLITGSLLVYLNTGSFRAYRDLKQSQQHLMEKKAGLSAESKQINKQLESYRPLTGLVEEINSVIEKKAFSWVMFFERMERSLPPQSFVVYINPSSTEAGREFRVRVALGKREDLKELLNNFQAEGFSNTRILNEIFQDGYFQVEMIFTDGQPE